MTAGLAENLEDPDKMTVIQNICTLLAGDEPTGFLVEIESPAEHIRSCRFMTTQEELLVAFYSDGVGREGSPGILAAVTIRGLSASKIVGIGYLTGIMQDVL
jgi:hypothetical protein